MVSSWSTSWFLEPYSKEEYEELLKRAQKHEGNALVFAGFKEVVVNYALWKSIDPTLQLEGFSDYDSAHYPNHPNRLDYRQCHGKGLAKFLDKGKYYIQFVQDSKPGILTIPFDVIVNVHSVGFPKVCHLPDRYLTYFVTLMNAFELALEQKKPIQFDERFYLIENITPYLFQQVDEWKGLFSRFLTNQQPRIEAELKAMLKTLYTLIDHRLFLDWKQYPSSIYHGVLDLGIDRKFIQADNPIAAMYREKYEKVFQRFDNK